MRSASPGFSNTVGNDSMVCKQFAPDILAQADRTTDGQAREGNVSEAGFAMEFLL